MVIAYSGGFYRSNTIALEGVPKTSRFECRSVPPGDYQITASVRMADNARSHGNTSTFSNPVRRDDSAIRASVVERLFETRRSSCVRRGVYSVPGLISGTTREVFARTARERRPLNIQLTVTN